MEVMTPAGSYTIQSLVIYILLSFTQQPTEALSQDVLLFIDNIFRPVQTGSEVSALLQFLQSMYRDFVPV